MASWYDDQRDKGAVDWGRDTAMQMAGPGLAVGAPVKAGEAVLGAGPIRAYHSSPHDFDKFDLSKIGTGEGAQVYGHGLYFAENPAVSGQGGQYWNQFMRHPSLSEAQQHAGGRLAAEGFDKERAIAATQRDVNDWLDIMKPNDYAAELRGTANSFSDKMHAKKMLELRQAELDALMSGKAGPRTYEVNINADPSHFLDWDKPFTSPDALEAFASKFDTVNPTTRRFLEDYSYANQKAGRPLPDGEDVFRELKALSSPKQFSQEFSEAGIPGIKYLDQGSRNYNHGTTQWIAEQGGVDKARAIAQTRYNDTIMKYGPASRDARDWATTLKEIDNPPTSNYVVFNPGIVDIMKKYGIAGAAVPVGMGALAAQDKYETQ